MRLRFSFLLLLLLAPLSGHAGSRVFGSLAGTLLEAEITSVAGDNVTLKRSSDGQPLTINRNTLCKEDIAYIAQWEADKALPGPIPAPAPPSAMPGAFEKYNLTVEATLTRSNQEQNLQGARVADHSHTFKILNQEPRRDLTGARAVILTLGRNVADLGGPLVLLQKVEHEVSVPAQGQKSLTTPSVTLTNAAELRQGVRSHGYVLFIVDAAGNVLHSQADPAGLDKFWKEISALPAEFPVLVDREFKPQPGIETLASYITF